MHRDEEVDHQLDKSLHNITQLIALGAFDAAVLQDLRRRRYSALVSLFRHQSSVGRSSPLTG